MNVLITGATGFVGSWLTKRLLKEGHKVRITHRKNSDLSEFENLDVEKIIADVTDSESLKLALKDIEVVFHLAGVIGYTKEERPLMDKVNVEGTRKLVNLCKNNPNIKRFIHMSSVVAVGASFDGTPLNEDSEFNLSHLNLGYFETKKQAEEIIVQACKEASLDAVMINPSTIYGPGDSKKGSRRVQLKVLQGKFPAYTPGGVSIVHIDDVVHCLIEAWKTGKTGERYIVSGENITIKKLFEIIAQRAGVKPPKILLPKPVLKLLAISGGLFALFGKKSPVGMENYWTSTLFHWFDSTKAQKAFNFKPKTAEQAIHDSVDWTLEHNNN